MYVYPEPVYVYVVELEVRVSAPSLSESPSVVVGGHARGAREWPRPTRA